MTTLDQLTTALLDYLNNIAQVPAQTIIPVQQDNPKPDTPPYCGQAFQFSPGRCEDTTVTALVVDIELLWERIHRYTSQKSRFITNKEGISNTDLYAFSPDEKDLYRQFLREAADRICNIFLPHTKQLPFKGYLFNEGVTITDTDNTTLPATPWAAGSFVRLSGNIYQSLQDVPVGIVITDRNYWEKVSPLYDTQRKIAYFLSTTIPGNAILDCLQAVENYLYAFVLWRWYIMANQYPEAQVWQTSFLASETNIKSALIVRTAPIRRTPHPW